MQWFETRGVVQIFLTTHAAIYNTFNTQPHLVSRKTLRQLRGKGSCCAGRGDRLRLICGGEDLVPVCG